MRRFKSKLIVGILVTFLTTSFAGPYMYAMSVTEQLPTEVDMQSIQAKRNTYNDYLEVINRVDKENCTTGSWAKYQEVVNRFNINESSSSWDIGVAMFFINIAQSQLNPDITVYNSYVKLPKDGYTSKTWKEYKDALEDNDIGRRYDVVELTNCVRNIKVAYAKLEADLSAYNAALAKVRSTDYTIVTWNAYMVVVNANIVTNKNKPAEVTAATNAILAAQTKLVKKAILTGYTAALDKVKEADYTIATWKVYKAILDANIVTVEDSQARVDDATSKILEAQKDLVLKADLTEYNKLATLVPEHYTADTWAVYKKVLDANVVTTEDTQTKVNDAVKKLEEAKKGLVFAGLADLNLAKVSTPSIGSAYLYTNNSWKALTNALKMPESTNPEIVAKTKAINDAVKGLITKVSFETLATAKSSVSNLKARNYTKGSWDALIAALNLAEDTDALVLAKAKAIDNARNALVFTGQADLDLAIENANTKLQINYSKASWQVLVDALAMPESTNKEVEAKTKAINKAIEDLVVVTNKDALTALINAQYTEILKSLTTNRTTFKLDSKEYSRESWALYTLSIDYALMVEADLDALQSEVNKAIDILNKGINDLVFIQKANLDAAVAKANALVKADYTTTSWKVLEDALKLSEKTNNEIIVKTAAINSVIGKLVFAGKADLTAAITKANAKVKAEYTAPTWKLLEDALKLPETTNAEVVTKTNAINNAINGLAKPPALIKYKVMPFIGLNCRVAPSITAKKVLAYTYGTILEISEIQNGWGKTKDGWVCMEYTTKQSSPVIGTYRVTPYIGLNCRAEANINSQKVTAYKYGTMLQILKIMNGWGNTNHGWVSMDYLALVQG